MPNDAPVREAPGFLGSVRGQLILWLLIPLVTVVIAASGLAYSAAIRFANEAYDASLYDEARSVSEQVRVTAGEATLRLPREALEILHSDPDDRVWFLVTTPDGSFIAGNRDFQPPPLGIILPGHVEYRSARIGTAPVRVAAYAAADTGARAHRVYVAETVIKRERLAGRILFATAASQVLLIALAALVAWFGIGHALVPLQNITAAIARRGHRDLSQIPDGGTPREILPLTRALNDLLARLGEAQAAQAHFVANAAHQLRTPLAGLAAQTEWAMKAGDPAAVAAALTHLDTSARRVVRLANQLLSLARAEPADPAVMALQRVNLAELARIRCMEWVPQALARRMDLGYAGNAQEAIVSGDVTLLGEILDNLIDNALRYAGPEGVVTVCLDAAGDFVELAVEDNGPGIPEAERERVLERFYRLPGSPDGGCGLGLAIVAEIATRHDARIRVGTARTGRGTRVAVHFRLLQGAIGNRPTALLTDRGEVPPVPGQYLQA